MKLRILYFGELREQVGLANEVIDVSTQNMNAAALIDDLAKRPGPWREALTSGDPLRIAINQEMASLDSALSENCEVAFFRPVTGG
jgi:sulfur-carrier protein